MLEAMSVLDFAWHLPMGLNGCARMPESSVSFFEDEGLNRASWASEFWQRQSDLAGSRQGPGDCQQGAVQLRWTCGLCLDMRCAASDLAKALQQARDASARAIAHNGIARAHLLAREFLKAEEANTLLSCRFGI